MASNLNSVTLSGRLTRDPELRTFPNGGEVAQMGLAVNRSYKPKDSDEWVESVSYFDIDSSKRVQNIVNKLRKGDPVSVIGTLEQRTWEAEDGSKREKVSVRVINIESEGFFRKNGDAPAASTDSSDVAAEDLATTSVADDDIPF